MAREYFCAYHSTLEAMRQLKDAERGRLFTALLVYSKTGEEVKLDGNERFVFDCLREQIDRDKAAYSRKCEINRENGRRGGQANATEHPRTGAKRSERPPNSQDKDKGKGEYTDYANTRAREEPDFALTGLVDEGMEHISEAYESNIGTISPSVSEQLREYRDKLEPECIVKAINSACDNGARTWAYIRRILDSKLARGISTAAQWDVDEVEWCNRRAQTSNRQAAYSRKQTVREIIAGLED